MRQQNLRGADRMFSEAAFIPLRESHLPDCGGGLQFVDFAWAFGPAKPLHTFGNCPRTHQHNLFSLCAQRSDLRRPAADRGMIETAPVICDEARPDFHYQSPGVCDDGTHCARSPKIMRDADRRPMTNAPAPKLYVLFLRLSRLARTRTRAFRLLAETHVCRQIFRFGLALCVRMGGDVVIHRVAQRFATLTRQRRDFEHRAVPAEPLAKRRDTRLALV